jgi:hypothetical protein
VRVVTPDGIIHTLAGNGTAGFGGDGGQAKNALLNTPLDVAVDSAGNVFIADSYNNRIRMVAPSGIITTVAGSGPSTGFGTSISAGDGLLAVARRRRGTGDQRSIERSLGCRRG